MFEQLTISFLLKPPLSHSKCNAKFWEGSQDSYRAWISHKDWLPYWQKG